MNTAYLLIGGNEGDRPHHLAQARSLVDDAGHTIVSRSALYETAAWGKTDQPAFLNQALRVTTSSEPVPLMRSLLAIEEKMGRIRNERYGSRLIDIDILFFNNTTCDSPELTVPHPQLQNRRFALVPMDEIAPDHLHPLLHLTIRELLAICPDTLEVKKWNIG